MFDLKLIKIDCFIEQDHSARGLFLDECLSLDKTRVKN